METVGDRLEREREEMLRLIESRLSPEAKRLLLAVPPAVAGQQASLKVTTSTEGTCDAD